MTQWLQLEVGDSVSVVGDSQWCSYSIIDARSSVVVVGDSDSVVTVSGVVTR